MSDMESLRRRDWDRHDEVPVDRGARPRAPRPFIGDPRYRPQRIRVPVPDFGRRMPRPPLGPRIPNPLRYIPLMRAIDLWEKMAEPNGLHPTHRDFHPLGMKRCDGPYYDPGPEAIGWFNLDWYGTDCYEGQLGGQVPGPWWIGNLPGSTCDGCGPQFDLDEPGTTMYWPDPAGNTPPEAIIYHIYCQPGLHHCTAHRGREHSSWVQEFEAQPFGVEVKAPALPDTAPWMPSPNIMRHLPPLPYPYPLGVGTTVSEQSELAEDWDKLTQAEQLMRAPTPEAWAKGITFTGAGTGTGGATSPRPSVGGQTVPRPGVSPGTKPKPIPFLPDVLPRPPEPGTKEKKASSRIRQLGVFLYNALDAMSENAELVDAMFKALPCSVQKRWSRGRPNRKGVDSFGQYGAAGADWKLQALWHNWHHVDAAEAWQNIAWNLLEDQFYGLIHRRGPVQVGGPGMRDQFLAFAELLKEMPLHQPKECS